MVVQCNSSSCSPPLPPAPCPLPLCTSPRQPPDLLVEPYHYAPIIAASLCVRKPIVATASEDRSIRLVNYQERRVGLNLFGKG